MRVILFCVCFSYAGGVDACEDRLCTAIPNGSFGAKGVGEGWVEPGRSWRQEEQSSDQSQLMVVFFGYAIDYLVYRSTTCR